MTKSTWTKNPNFFFISDQKNPEIDPQLKPNTLEKRFSYLFCFLYFPVTFPLNKLIK